MPVYRMETASQHYFWRRHITGVDTMAQVFPGNDDEEVADMEDGLNGVR